MHRDTPICLVDIPSFDDSTGLSDNDIFQQLFSRLADTQQIEGLLYFYDISVVRIGGQSQEVSYDSQQVITQR